MRGCDKSDRLFSLCCCAIAVALVHLSQQAWRTTHERSSSSRVVLTLAPAMAPKIVVPEPDPAMYGHLLEDRAMARVHLVSLGD